MRTLRVLIAVVGLLLLAGLARVWAGVFDVAADSAHHSLTVLMTTAHTTTAAPIMPGTAATTAPPPTTIPRARKTTITARTATEPTFVHAGGGCEGETR